MHHSVDHLITHGNVDQATHATTGWTTSVRTPAFLQLIYGIGLHNHDDDDDDDDDDILCWLLILYYVHCTFVQTSKNTLNIQQTQNSDLLKIDIWTTFSECLANVIHTHTHIYVYTQIPLNINYVLICMHISCLFTVSYFHINLFVKINQLIYYVNV